MATRKTVKKPSSTKAPAKPLTTPEKDVEEGAAEQAKPVKAVKKPAAKKTAAKKVATKKVASKTVTPKAAKKPVSKKTTARTKGFLYVPKEQYNELIEGLMAQGLDRDDAVLTLKVGLRQANGRPVPADLLAQCANDPFAAAEEPEVETEQLMAA